MIVLLALACVAIGSAVAEVLRYRAIADMLGGFERGLTEQSSKYGLDIRFTQLPSVAIGPTIMVVVVLAAIAAGLVTLALALRRPRPRARVSTLVAAGTLAVLAIAQAGIALTSQLALNQVDAEFQSMQQSMGKQYQNVAALPAVGDLMPRWPYYVDYVTSALAVIGCAAVIALLAKPGARTWFAAANGGPNLSTAPLSVQSPGAAPVTPVVDTQTIVSDPWLRSIVSELMTGPRSLADLQAGPLGTNPEVLNWRLWDLINAGVVSQSPSSTSPVYVLTPRGENLRMMFAETNRGEQGSSPGQ
ncbi:winged helix-turn-helix transcriptional regulator [Amycolatopsis cynarae]|uniref:Winged helix-turn-helix transcriptional regulator n=1 Tax=Amycolatopsis cynarae TaxID=2995223 RepID=A0ABY7B660_9PSEU|nr:winged helix-turn-helix transcriptional regulator [Amycolatopsis sp. HUAS 11-8]WAL67826.1 winged helix-turn-helix transcriptional regulator [Amycolatopsis sp. HUAS 11-8]